MQRIDDVGWYSAKTVYRHRLVQVGVTKTVFEERVVLFQAANFEDAIAKAETEANRYCSAVENVVYLGFGMLLIGVFLMFYLPHRRLWIWLRQDGTATQVLFAGTSHRDQIGFDKEFSALQHSLEGRLKAL